MKKKLVFKKWVECLLFIVNMLCILILASECDRFDLFVISKLIGGVILCVNVALLTKYGRNN